jgi:hypothetical protein
MQDVIKIMIRDKKKGTFASAFFNQSSSALWNFFWITVSAGVSVQPRFTPFTLIWWPETVIQKKFHDADDDWLKKAEAKVPFKRLNKPIDVARAAAYFCSEESGLTTGSIIDYDQTVLGWHSYSAYDTNILDDSLLGE